MTAPPSTADLRDLLERLRRIRTHMSVSPQAWLPDVPETTDRMVKVTADRLRGQR